MRRMKMENEEDIELGFLLDIWTRAGRLMRRGNKMSSLPQPVQVCFSVMELYTQVNCSHRR